MSFENPEVAAMDAIARILQELPDEASRLRVMRWAFGRYSDEFKRPVLGHTPAPALAPVRPSPPVPPVAVAAPAPVPAPGLTQAPPPVQPREARLTRVPDPAPKPVPQKPLLQKPSAMQPAEAAMLAMPEVFTAPPPAGEHGDFGEQISELNDLFPGEDPSAISDPFVDIHGI